MTKTWSFSRLRFYIFKGLKMFGVGWGKEGLEKVGKYVGTNIAFLQHVKTFRYCSLDSWEEMPKYRLIFWNASASCPLKELFLLTGEGIPTALEPEGTCAPALALVYLKNQFYIFFHQFWTLTCIWERSCWNVDKILSSNFMHFFPFGNSSLWNAKCIF